MADNYLERRMEDMKAGRLRPQVQQKTSAPRKGYIEFPFSPRRVLVMGGTQGLPLDIVRMFLKTGSKVAVFDTDKPLGDSLAYKEGIRYYNLEDPSSESITSAFANLLQAWRDVDIIIVAKFQDSASGLVSTWTAHRDRFPVPFGYAGRLILLHPESFSPRGFATHEPNISETLFQLSSQLHPYRITANAIIKSADPLSELRDPIRLIQTLVLPGNDFLTSLLIPF